MGNSFSFFSLMKKEKGAITDIKGLEDYLFKRYFALEKGFKQGDGQEGNMADLLQNRDNYSHNTSSLLAFIIGVFITQAPVDSTGIYT